MGDFENAGRNLVERLERGLHEFAKDVMRESLVECPISGPETYIETWGTKYRTINGQIVYFDDQDPYIEGDEGTLRRSARVFPPTRDANSASVLLGYGFGDEVNPAGRRAAEYAVPVHERHELRHTPPTKSGYLLDPMLAAAPWMGTEIATKSREQGAAGEIVTATGAELQEGL